jgi:hypothetical protein
MGNSPPLCSQFGVCATTTTIEPIETCGSVEIGFQQNEVGGCFCATASNPSGECFTNNWKFVGTTFYNGFGQFQDVAVCYFSGEKYEFFPKNLPQCGAILGFCNTASRRPCCGAIGCAGVCPAYRSCTACATGFQLNNGTCTKMETSSLVASSTQGTVPFSSSTRSPETTVLLTSTSSPMMDDNTGRIVGGVIGALVAVGLLLVFAFGFWKFLERKRAKVGDGSVRQGGDEMRSEASEAVVPAN